jgi:hypothetical protein
LIKITTHAMTMKLYTKQSSGADDCNAEHFIVIASMGASIEPAQNRIFLEIPETPQNYPNVQHVVMLLKWK